MTDVFLPVTAYDAEGIEPDIDQLQQEEYRGPAVPVRLTGPVTANELPTRDSTSRSINVAQTIAGSAADAAEQIATADPRRKYLTVLCTGNPILIGHTKQEVLDAVCGVLPVGVPLNLPTSEPVWVRSTAAGGSVVSYWSGCWAD